MRAISSHMRCGTRGALTHTSTTGVTAVMFGAACSHAARRRQVSPRVPLRCYVLPPDRAGMLPMPTHCSPLSVTHRAENTSFSVLSANRPARPASEHERLAVDSTRHEAQSGCATARRRRRRRRKATQLPTLPRTAAAGHGGRRFDAAVSPTAAHADPSPTGGAASVRDPVLIMLSCTFSWITSISFLRAS